jgi:hypothetical protein
MTHHHRCHRMVQSSRIFESHSTHGEKLTLHSASQPCSRVTNGRLVTHAW